MAPTSRICTLFRCFLMILGFLVGGLSSAGASPSLPDGRWTPQGYEVRVSHGMVADVLVSLFSRWYAQSAQAQGFPGEVLDLKVLQMANDPGVTVTSCLRNGRVERVSSDAWHDPGCRRYLGLREGTWLLVPSRPLGRGKPLAAVPPPSGAPAVGAAPTMSPPVDPAESAVACLREGACRSRIAAMGLLAPTSPPPPRGRTMPPAPLLAAFAAAFVAAIALAAYLGARMGGKTFSRRLIADLEHRLQEATTKLQRAIEEGGAMMAAAAESHAKALDSERRLASCRAAGAQVMVFLGLDVNRFPDDEVCEKLPQELANKVRALTEGSTKALARANNMSLGSLAWWERPIRAASLLASEVTDRDRRIEQQDLSIRELRSALTDVTDALVTLWDEARGFLSEKHGRSLPEYPPLLDRLTAQKLYDLERRSTLPEADSRILLFAE